MTNDVILAFQSFGVGVGVLAFLGAACLIEARVRSYLASAQRSRTNFTRSGRFA